RSSSDSNVHPVLRQARYCSRTLRAHTAAHLRLNSHPALNRSRHPVQLVLVDSTQRMVPWCERPQWRVSSCSLTPCKQVDPTPPPLACSVLCAGGCYARGVHHRSFVVPTGRPLPRGASTCFTGSAHVTQCHGRSDCLPSFSTST